MPFRQTALRIASGRGGQGSTGGSRRGAMLHGDWNQWSPTSPESLSHTHKKKKKKAGEFILAANQNCKHPPSSFRQVGLQAPASEDLCLNAGLGSAPAASQSQREGRKINTSFIHISLRTTLSMYAYLFLNKRKKKEFRPILAFLSSTLTGARWP